MLIARLIASPPRSMRTRGGWSTRPRRGGFATPRRAIALRPDFAEAFALGGYILERGGKPEVALRFYRARWSSSPISARLVQSRQAAVRGRRVSPRRWLRSTRGLRVRPATPTRSTRAPARLRSLGRLDEVAEAARAALRRRPDFPEAAVNLGTALLKAGRPEAALAAYRQARRAAARLRRRDVRRRRLALRALGRLDEARAAFDRAVALGCREAVSGRGCLDLMLGDFESGWEGYEARWVDGKSLGEALGVRYPLWSGPGGAAAARAGHQRSRARRHACSSRAICR